MPMPWSKEGKLIAAVKSNNFIKVRELLNKKANPNVFDMADRHILSHACARGNPEIIKLLLESGSDPNQAVYEGHTALMSVNKSENVNLLLKHGARVDDKNKYGWTALIIAAREGDIRIVKILLKAGADPDIVDNLGRNAIMFAHGRKHHEIFKLLNHD